MQSHLGDYPNSRSNPKQKFIRAVDSFLAQEYVDKKLIIVSDGCDITHQIYHDKYINYANIKHVYVHRSTLKNV
jgi:glycosyltransferase involved in cell wall biosynthesis